MFGRRLTAMAGCVAVVSSLLVAGSATPAAATTSMDLGDCTQVEPLDVDRSKQTWGPDCQRILYRYGPLHITPGDNLILFGPVSVEKPSNGYMVRFVPDLIDVVDKEPPPIHEIHLHHAVWISSGHGQPMISTGEEKTVKNFPNGYGLRVEPNHRWLLNYMIHNQLASPRNVYVTWTIDFVPIDAVAPGEIKPIEPIWLNVGGYNGFNPTYNSVRAYDADGDGECVFPKEACAAVGPYHEDQTDPAKDARRRGARHVTGVGQLVRVNTPGTIVYMDGHIHPGGLRMEADLRRNGERVHAFTSDALYFNGDPVSWDMATEATTDTFRLQVQEGDEWIVNSVYETRRGSWYEAMGIIHYFIDPTGTEGKDPFSSDWDQAVDPHNAGITHGKLDEAGFHGGDDIKPLAGGTKRPTDVVTIQNFNYLPGGRGTEALGIPAVQQGDGLLFVNADAAAQIYHTVTACAAPCTGVTGMSYPLADGPVDFDSQELGYAPRGTSPASGRAHYILDTTDMPAGTYTYWCRVHPDMRGQFVVEEA